MHEPLKIAVIGAGAHSAENHLPALQRHAAEHPGEITLAGLCDLDIERAQAAAAKFGFAAAYGDWREMLERCAPGAVIAVTPSSITAHVAQEIMRMGMPLLMEKPLGATIGEARAVAAAALTCTAPVMVSMNRRFDPALRAGVALADDRPVTYLRATFARERRDEPDFIEYTAIHVVDAVLSVLGDVAHAEIVTERRHGAPWYFLHLRFAAGGYAVIEVMPTAQCNAEAYELTGSGYRVSARSGWFDTGVVQLYEGNALVHEERIDPALPAWVRNGTLAETVAFIGAVRAGTRVSPIPAEVLNAVELCHTAARRV